MNKLAFRIGIPVRFPESVTPTVSKDLFETLFSGDVLRLSQACDPRGDDGIGRRAGWTTEFLRQTLTCNKKRTRKA